MICGIMTARLVALVVMVGTGLSLPALSHSQDKGTATAPYLRVEWELSAARGGYRNMCGRVYNTRSVTARRVGLLAEGIDGAGQVVSTRYKEVLGDVPGSGYSFFCVPLEAGAATYRVSVRGADWGFESGQ